MNTQIGCGFLLLLQCENTSFLQTHTLLLSRTCAYTHANLRSKTLTIAHTHQRLDVLHEL